MRLSRADTPGGLAGSAGNPGLSWLHPFLAQSLPLSIAREGGRRALGKLLTDENFRERFFASPELACWEAGFALSPVELEALSRVSSEALTQLSEALDKRISRPSLDPAAGDGKVTQS
jgi:hypothetical protein